MNDSTIKPAPLKSADLKLKPYVRILARILHRLTVRKDHWCFVVSDMKPWGGNLRAMCDASIADPRITSITIINCGITADPEIRKRLNDPNKKVKIVSHKPPLKSYCDLFTASHIFHEDYSLNGWPNYKVNLWHGIPIKNIGAFQTYRFSNGSQSKPMSAKRFNRNDCLISSSAHDRVVMSACFQMSPEKVWNCGLPRNDWLNPELPLPDDLHADFQRIEALKADRRLVLYTPTFRDANKKTGSLPLEETVLDELKSLASQHNAVLGIRLHPSAERVDQDTGTSRSSDIIDCSGRQFPELQVLLRATDVLITDYSSTCLDFCITERPSISFSPDLEDYKRGLLYPLETVFPGPVVSDLQDLRKSLIKALSTPDAFSPQIRNCLRLFHEPNRASISKNLIEALLTGEGNARLNKQA